MNYKEKPSMKWQIYSAKNEKYKLYIYIFKNRRIFIYLLNYLSKIHINDYTL